MRILVTGGNGYVGRTLCRMLLSEHELCVIDALRGSEGLRLAPDEVARLRLEPVDIRRRAEVERVIQDFAPEAIIHLAAIHFIPECESDPELAVSTNVLGTSNIASLCPPECRLVFASTGAVYQPQDEPHHETQSPIGPADVYGWTKLQGEQYVRYFSGQRRFPAVIIRLFNVMGPGETSPHVLPEIVAQLKAGRTTLRLGNLEPKRDYVHVDDVARGFFAAASRGVVARGETVVANLGTSRSYSVAELLDYLRACSGIDIQVETDPARMRKSDRPFLAADITTIGERFQWSPRWGIAEALADLWQHPDIPASWVERYR